MVFYDRISRNLLQKLTAKTHSSQHLFLLSPPNNSPIPHDSLDINLASQYNHSDELFKGKNDVVIQEETIGQATFRRLRNTRDLSPEKIIPLKHPLQIGGLQEKASPNTVKLMNTGPHTPLTNPGYSRQTGDGNFFNY